MRFDISCDKYNTMRISILDGNLRKKVRDKYFQESIVPTYRNKTKENYIRRHVTITENIES